MNQTDLSLLDQMRITDLEFERRKAYIGFDDADVAALVEVRRIVLEVCDDLVERFYAAQTRVPEIALLIGDADTLRRLAAAMGQYVVELFSGLYDLEYVSDRLRIGLVHKRIGVDPTLYLSAMHQLRRLLGETIDDGVDDPALRHAAQVALDKLFTLDTTLVFETYVRMLVAEVEESRNRAERYAQELEEKVRERTRQLEELAHTDALTGLLNMRHIDHALTRALRGAQRRAEPVTVIFIDIDDFKQINDHEGHPFGDEVLRSVATILQRVLRADDNAFRYGGDEFCLILPNCDEQQAMAQIVTRIEAELETVNDAVSLSFGVAQTGPARYVSGDALLAEADRLMYAAKRAHKRDGDATP